MMRSPRFLVLHSDDIPPFTRKVLGGDDGADQRYNPQEEIKGEP
jgi:hypothetical protein